MDGKRAWECRDGESSPAYEAFRTYMRVRSIPKVAAELSKSEALIKRWSSGHEWISRIAEYDSYLANADVDGEVNRLSRSRDKILDLMDKLTGLLDMVLDDHIAKREPPSVKWSQAANIAAQIQRNFLLLKAETKSSEAAVRALGMIRRMEELMAGAE